MNRTQLIGKVVGVLREFLGFNCDASLLRNLRSPAKRLLRLESLEGRDLLSATTLVSLIVVIVATIFQANVVNAQTNLNNDANTRLFNILPITIPNEGLYQCEQMKLEALKDVVLILGQESFLSSILTKFKYGKDTPRVAQFVYVNERMKEIEKTASTQGYAQALVNFQIDSFFYSNNSYGNILFDVYNEPFRKSGLIYSGFIDIVLLKNSFFGDKIVLINSDGYIELEITGPDDDAPNTTEGNQIISTDAKALQSYNRIIKAKIVAYENALIPVLYFDKTGMLRELDYLRYERPFDFYDVLSQNDPEVLASMKDNDSLEYYVRYFRDNLPSNPTLTDRIIKWDAQGRLVEYVTRNTTDRDVRKRDSNIVNDFFPERSRPISFFQDQLFGIKEFPNKISGMTEDESYATDALYKALDSVNAIKDVYHIDDAISENVVNASNDAHNLLFVSLNALDTNLFVHIGFENAILGYHFKDSRQLELQRETLESSNSADVKLHNMTIQYVNNAPRSYTFKFDSKNNLMDYAVTNVFLDDDSKYLYRCYQHNRCIHTSGAPNIKDAWFDLFVNPCKPVSIHYVRANTETGELQEKSFDATLSTLRSQNVLVGSNEKGEEVFNVGDGEKANEVVRSNNGPRAKIDEFVYDFGILEKNPAQEKGEHLFYIENVGNETLTLADGGKSNFCIDFTISKSSVEPGDKAIITVKWDAARSKGVFNHSVQVLTNDPNMKGAAFNVRGFYSFSSPPELVFSPVTATATIARSFKIVGFEELGDGSPMNLEINKIELADPEHFEVSVEKGDLANLTQEERENKLPTEATGLFNAVLTVKPGAPLGAFQNVLRLHVNSKKTPILEIPIRGQVVSDVIKVVGSNFDDKIDGALDLGVVNRTLTE